MFKPIIIIPFYNHINGFKKIVRKISTLNYPVIVIDDGSIPNEQKEAKQLCKKFNFTFLENKTNMGKGYVVKKAMTFATQKGFSHALQIDADGQHKIEDIKDFFALAQENPTSIINSHPIYDTSIPKARLYGRKITNFWTFIETGGKRIPDSMCGFRVYPLKEMKKILPLIHQNRMGFDIEILIKSIILKINIVNKKTPVIYPLDGVSHFKTLRDNWHITLTHTKLCLFAILNLIKRQK